MALKIAFVEFLLFFVVMKFSFAETNEFSLDNKRVGSFVPPSRKSLLWNKNSEIDSEDLLGNNEILSEKKDWKKNSIRQKLIQSFHRANGNILKLRIFADSSFASFEKCSSAQTTTLESGIFPGRLTFVNCF